MRPALLTALFSCLAPPARPAEVRLPPALVKKQLELSQLVSTMEPAAAELEGLAQRYALRGLPLRETLERRRELRARLEADLERLDGLDTEYKTLKGMVEAQLVAATVASMIRGGELKDHTDKLAVSKRLSEFTDSARGIQRRARVALNHDEKEFQAALARRRIERVLAVAAGAGGILASGGLLILLRRRLRAPAGALPDASSSASAPAEATGPVEIGRMLNGNYRVLRELGRGGMGLVFEALDVALDRRVAVKRMREELQRNPKELEMFLSEARLVASLKHPNTVEIHSILREGRQTYLVFEYVEGKPLSTYLEEGGRLSLRSTKSIVRQVASALDHAHANRIIHRDLKPSNVMITPQGVAKVMDFGIAHRAKATVARLTRAEAWGTPAYMAPEQELGTVSKESDLYSLAVCLYEMLTGRQPFEGPNYLAQKSAMRFDPPSSRVPGLPKEIDLIVARGLRAEPKERFESAAQFAAALEALHTASL